MADPYIIPEVGSSGVWTLRSPFDVMIAKNVRYKCQEIRRISGYIANNEDVKTTVYTANKISEAVYEEDLASDSDIVSLQGETGQWLYVPVRYIVSYPTTNGVNYRTSVVAVSLPALPANTDMTNFFASITNLVSDTFGVNCQIEQVETSKVTQVPSDKHSQIQAQRKVITGAPATDRSRYVSTLRDLTEAISYIHQLEAYITTHVTVPTSPPSPTP